jgi:TRAP-type C4-dicarboxylate transport system permease large subunit
MQIGYFTPPVGMNLFIASYRFDKPVSVLYRATLPFFFILLFAVLIITYWPELSLVFVSSHP